jgi:hypothetical protein
MVQRNFWISATIDGRQSTLRGGPKDGGFALDIYQLSKGQITNPIYITGEVRGDHLVLTVRDRTSGAVWTNVTER